VIRHVTDEHSGRGGADGVFTKCCEQEECCKNML